MNHAALALSAAALLVAQSVAAQQQPPEQAQEQPPEQAQEQPPEQAQEQPPEQAGEQPPEQAQEQPPEQAQAQAEGAGESLEAEVTTAEGDSAGTVTFQQVARGVVVTAELENLPEGPHGFHIHETGTCEPPDFESAGGHYNPQDNEHGFDTAEGHHAGDLPNIHVTADGTATAEFFTPLLTVEAQQEQTGEPPFTLQDEDGSAIMVHAEADDYRSTDSAGSRIACGVIAEPQS